MKKTYLWISVALTAIFSVQVRAQEHNKISLELEGGLTKAMDPFTNGYYPGLARPYHLKGSIRAMANPSIGIKLSYSYDNFKSLSGGLPFNSNAQAVILEGVLNLARMGQLEQFTKHINIFVHGGAGIGFLSGTDLAGASSSDRFGTIVFGVTPQIRITEKFSVLLDLTMHGNTRQDRTFDYKSSTNSRGFDGYYANLSAGVSFSLGKKPKNIDWKFSNDELETELQKLRSELDEMRKRTSVNETELVQLNDQLNDDDNDGVANYLDIEKNTQEKNTVDTKGQSVPSLVMENLFSDTIVGKKLFYTVQLGVYSRAVPDEFWRNIKPIYVLDIEDGTRRYFNDYFKTVEEAKAAHKIALSSGLSDAFVTAYYKGKRITLFEASELTKQQGPSILRDK